MPFRSEHCAHKDQGCCETEALLWFKFGVIVAKGDVYCGRCTVYGGSAKWAERANNKAAKEWTAPCATCLGQCTASIFNVNGTSWEQDDGPFDLKHVRHVLPPLEGPPPDLVGEYHMVVDCEPAPAPAGGPAPCAKAPPPHPGIPPPAIEMLHGLRDVITTLLEQVQHLRAQQDAMRAGMAELHGLIREQLSVLVRTHGSESEASEFVAVEQPDIEIREGMQG